MSDIFISYSRKDSEQALQLAERLQGEGMSVWIDQRGIEAAKTWSEEIVNAIEGSKAFVLLLSSSSIESDNVARELSLAFESKRPLVPVAIEDVALTPKFKYPLAGVQRVAYTEFAAITSALKSSGITPAAKQEAKPDARINVLVMPFQDLSSGQDNLWFADGLSGELIDKLSQIKALRLIDRTTSRELRKSTLSLTELTRLMDARYVIEGSVQKFGEQIKISVSVLRSMTGEHVWQEHFRGVMNDIFDLQESVAERVAIALEVHLHASERLALGHTLTTNATAYEYWLKANEALWSNVSNASMEQAAHLFAQVVRHDPSMVVAWGNIAKTHLQIYRFYDPSQRHIDIATQAIERVRELEGESAQWHWLLASKAFHLRDYDSSEREARTAISIDPRHANSYNMLGWALRAKYELEGAIEAFYDEIALRPDLNSEFMLLTAMYENDDPRLREAARDALLRNEKHLQIYPGDMYRRVQCAVLYFFAGYAERATHLADELALHPGVESLTLANLAALYDMLGETSKGIGMLKRSLELGYVNLATLRRFGPPMSEEPEFIELIAELEKRVEGS